MAENKQQVFPLAPANGHARSDEESPNSASNKELKRKKRIRLILFCVVFQVVVPTVFFAIVLQAKTPKLRLSDEFEFQTLETNVNESSPSFDMSFTTQVRIKNTNWGPYKFENTTMNFTYNGEIVGQVLIPKGKAGFKSTKKVNVDVSLSSSRLRNTANLGSELNSGVLTLSSTAKMKGKVTIMLIVKSKKTANMNCTINVHVKEKTVNLKC